MPCTHQCHAVLCRAVHACTRACRAAYRACVHPVLCRTFFWRFFLPLPRSLGSASPLEHRSRKKRNAHRHSKKINTQDKRERTSPKGDVPPTLPRRHVRTHVRAHVRTHDCTYVCAHVRTHECTHVCAHVRTHVRAHVRTHTHGILA